MIKKNRIYINRYYQIRQSLIAIFATFFIALPTPAFAVSLGKMTVNSLLGEQLDMQVELNSVSPAELGTMDVGLASRLDFDRAGINYPPFAVFMEFDIKDRGDGRFYIEITSNEIVDDTFLHLLVSASWSGGKVLREYTALLDPPLYSSESSSVIDVPTLTEESGATSASDLSDGGIEMAVDSTSDGSSMDISSSESLDSNIGSSVTVKKGDTLSAILNRLNRPASEISLNQGLYALFKANPDAFIQNNMNLLRVGAELTVPSFSEMSSQDNAIASAEYSRQLQSFRDYSRNRIAEQSEIPEPTDVAQPIDSAAEEALLNELTDDLMSESESGEAQDQSVSDTSNEAIEPSGNDEVGTEADSDSASLVIGQKTEDKFNELETILQGDITSDTVSTMKMQLANLEETLYASGSENTDAQNRLKVIQAQVKLVDSLLNIEDRDLATLQDNASDDGAAESNETASVESDTAETTKSESVTDNSATTASATTEAKTEEPAQAETATTAAESVAEINTNEDTIQVAETAAEAPAEPSNNTGTSRKVVKSGLLDSLGGILGSIGGLFGSLGGLGLKIAAGLVAVLIGVFFYRRRQSQIEFEDSLIDIESEQLSQATNQYSDQRLNSGAGIDLASQGSNLELTVGGGMSFLSEEGIAGVNEEDNEVIQSTEVDPLAEADVYLAYDRDEQAIQVLKEAYNTHPERQELAEKLLEIYHKQDDKLAFDDLAQEVNRRKSPGTNPGWEKIVEMGLEVSPDNKLFTEDQSNIDSDSALQFDSNIVSSSSESIELDIEDESLELMSDNSVDTVIKDLDLGDLEVDNDSSIEFKTDEPKDDTSLDAPTLSQIIQGPDVTINDEEAEGSQSGDKDLQPEEELNIEISDDEFEFNLGDDPEPELAISEDDGLEDFQLELDSEDNAAPSLDIVEPEAPETVDIASNVESLDEDSYLSEASQQSIGNMEPYHESETALELAKAYIELGEKDIAKGFIEEVISDGNEKQKKKAEELVKNLAD